MKTLKQTSESDLMFIGKVIKKSLEISESSWDMTVRGVLMLGIACKNNVGMALYMLNEIDPQPEALVTDSDIVDKFPLGFEGNWDETWDEFCKGDQRAVFKK